MLSKIIAVFLLMISLTFASFAQETVKRDPQIRRLKIEFVTQRMSLTQTQLQKFLPLFNKYSDELLVYRFAIKKLKKNPDSNFAVEEQKLEGKMLEIKGRYKNDFLKIISAQQLAAMYKAEVDFKDFLLDHLKKP